MSQYSKINWAAAIGLPLLAVLGSLVIFGVRADTQVFIFGTNGIPMLIGAVVSALLLRSVRRKGGGGEFIALLPTLVPAAFGVLWYGAGVLIQDADSGREYFAGPFYLLAWAIGTALVASLLCVLKKPANLSG